VSSDALNRTHARTDLPIRLLGIYLNDHLAGATSGVELARRTASAHRGGAAGPVLERIAAEITEDRNALLDIMIALDIPVRRYKVYAGWATEKAGRLKFNGRIRERSPLSGVVEFEALWLGVHGKLAAWKVLRDLAERDGRLDTGRLDQLIARARRQTETLDRLRTRTAAEVFRTGSPGS
jgi:hypothetical protein